MFKNLVGFLLVLFAAQSALLAASATGTRFNTQDLVDTLSFNRRIQISTNQQGDVLFKEQFNLTNNVVPLVKPVIETADDGATARNGRHTVHFTSNLKDDDAIRIVLGEGRVLQGRVIALSISDQKGKRVWLGQLKDSQGEIVANGDESVRVLYPDAFHGIRADVLFSYRTDPDSFEQDVVLRENPTLPEEIDESTARIEVWSAFVRPPEPRKLKRQLVLRQSSNNERAIIEEDESLDFGAARILSGKAFQIGEDQAPRGKQVAVGKKWIKDGNTGYLLEFTDYLALKPGLSKLERRQAQNTKVTLVDNLTQIERFFSGRGHLRTEKQSV